MFRPSKTVTVGFLTCIVVLRGTVHAQVTTTTAKATTTTTSTTTSTTSTTLQPHPFSPATRQCVRNARQAHDCHHTPPGLCSSAFQTAYAACFAGSTGMKCATKCLTNESKCFSSIPTTRSKCLKTCRTNRKADTNACRQIPNGNHIWAGGDLSCLMTKDITFSNCKFQCSKPQQKMDCETTFTFCIADCPNL